MMNIDNELANSTLTEILEDDYLRLQVYTNATLDTYGSKWYAIMENDGQRMFDDPIGNATNEQLKNFIRLIVDEKYAPATVEQQSVVPVVTLVNLYR